MIITATADERRPPLITAGVESFAHDWNARSFAFTHALSNHPLFCVQSLREVARRIPAFPGFVHWQNGQIEVTDKWEINTAPRLSLDETLAGIATNNSQVILKHAEQDPEIGPVLRQLLEEIVELSPPGMRDEVTIGESIIFISSPQRLTKYHLDLEANYLLQVSGCKTLHVFDASIVSNEELETQCCGDQNAARYRPELQALSASYDLAPGAGVHFPSTAPHWVQNGADTSVSININFELRAVHGRLRYVHRFNRRLRRLGLKPTAPGQSSVLDRAKAALETGVSGLRSTLSNGFRPSPAQSFYPVWRPSRKVTVTDDAFC